MTRNRTRSLFAAVAVTAAVGVNVVALAPAYAGGGDNQVYIYGNTYDQCQKNLAGAVKTRRANGYNVTSVTPCRKTGDGKRWFGYYYYS